VSPLNHTQIGTLGEQEFIKLLMLGTNGAIECARPVTDDERRDLETHIHGQFGRSLAFQVKCTSMINQRTHLLAIDFKVPKGRVVSSPYFWYCFAYLDKKAMVFGDPVFLVPSAEVHAHAAPRLRGDVWSFAFRPNMKPTSRDRWHTYRFAPRNVGKRVLQVLRKMPAKPAASPEGLGKLSRLPDLVWALRA
jgi:hypothetical protein